MAKSKIRGPRNWSKSEFRKAGIELIDASAGAFCCLQCGKGWLVNQPPSGERRVRGWWKCPNRCNS
jgi:hypothetical protein